MRPGRLARVLAVLATAPAALWLGCGGGGADLTGPALGTIEITTATSGPEPDTDGYAVSVDGAAAEAVGANETRRRTGVAVGAHVVELSGMAANCTAAGGTRVSVSVTTDVVAVASFAVTCTPTTGAIHLTTSTGAPGDPDGYRLLLDGVESQPIGASAAITLPGVAPGAHAVGLDGVTPSCRVDGDNPRSVVVVAGETAEVAIVVSCTATPPPAGGLTITTETSGPDQDADGYAVTVDGGAGQPIGANESLSLSDLAPGEHSVGLTGLSANCRLDGDNPRPATVTAGTVAALTLDVACVPRPPSTGTIELTTVTTGPNSDPDGYTFAIDGSDAQAIGVNATESIASVAAGTHTLTLAGASANCAVGGENPRNVTVPAGGTAAVTYRVTCTAATGRLTVTTATTGSPADPDGYTVSIDGGSALAVGVAASVTVQALEPGAHAVSLAGLAPNCAADGENPRSVTVAAGETAATTFAIACTPVTGSLALTISGLPSGADAAVTVTGPGGYTQQVTGTRTLTDLAPGSYTVGAGDVTSGGIRYTVTPASRTVAVAAAATASVTITYGPAAGPALNLRIDGWHLTQSVQSASGGVPLVEDRDGYLRVFVVSNEANTAAPSVRVRLYRDGALATTLTIASPAGSTPTSRDEGRLASSWNVKIPRGFIGPGLAVLADVDPGNTVPEKDEGDNSFPVSGTPQAEDVRTASVLGVRFVPVKQRANGLLGDVSAGNKADFLDLTRRIYPLPGTDGDLHDAYTTTIADPLQPEDANGAWVTILSEIDALRVAEGTDRTYYGVVRTAYGSGIAGLGYLGLPTAMGYDNAFDRGRVMAHELGHTWNRQHSPCGNPGGVDPAYPYPGGVIGVYGVDRQDEVLKDPSFPDIMGYCADPWISDYTYQAVLAYRAGAGASAGAASAREQPCLLVWGRIVAGRPVLEPAFELVTRPNLPRGSGPYSVEGLAADGTPLFSLRFDASAVADDPRGTRHFAFAVPLSDRSAARLESVRLAGPGGATAAVRTAAPAAAARAPDSTVARRIAGGVALHWDAAAHPMVMVRDPATGEVLSFARGGDVEVATTEGELEVIASDRVRSQRMRVIVRR